MSGNIKVMVVPDGLPQPVEVHLVDEETSNRNDLLWFILKMELLGYHVVGFISAQDQPDTKDGPSSTL